MAEGRCRPVLHSSVNIRHSTFAVLLRPSSFALRPSLILIPVFTIGHSTRSLDDFIGLLRENGVERLADIRRYPGSRRYPHFSSESLAQALPEHGIAYI